VRIPLDLHRAIAYFLRDSGLVQTIPFHFKAFCGKIPKCPWREMKWKASETTCSQIRLVLNLLNLGRVLFMGWLWESWHGSDAVTVIINVSECVSVLFAMNPASISNNHRKHMSKMCPQIVALNFNSVFSGKPTDVHDYTFSIQVRLPEWLIELKGG